MRNPWDWLVSLAAWKNKPGGFDAQNPNQKLSKEQFGIFFDEQIAKIINGIVLDGHLATQESYLVNNTGKMIIDNVGKFEDLGDFWKIICKKLGIELPLEKRMRSAHEHYSYYYSDEEAKLIGEIYADDCKLFDYRFERK